MAVFPSPLLDIDLIGPTSSFKKPGRWFDLPLDFDDSGQLYVDHELSLIYGFLHAFKETEVTQKNYTKELEKLIQWSYRVKETSILKIGRDLIQEYLDFLRTPPRNWIGATARPKFIIKNGSRIINSKWRPFTSKDPSNYTLRDASLQFSISTLQSFYKWLIEEQQTDINPIALIRQKKALVKTDLSVSPIKKITDLQCDYLLRAATKLAEDNPKVHERSLFVVTIMISMYLRISDLAPYRDVVPLMKHFFRDENEWWFLAYGKGNKQRRVTVSDDTLDALKRYRSSLGMSPLPLPNDDSFLFPSLRKANSANAKPYLATTRQFQRMLDPIFNRAHLDMTEDGLEDEAIELLACSAHWMRHTGISNDIKHRPREHIKEDAGHESIQTTDKYIDTEFKERHASAKHKKIAFE